MHENNSGQEAEGEGEEDGEGEAEEPNTHGIEVGLNSNGFSTYGVHSGAYIAKYKMVNDKGCVDDRELLDQESTNPFNTRSIIFFIACIVLLCIGCAAASYESLIIDEDAALSVFLMVIIAIPLDVFLFRVIICACVSFS